jgi:hypothetical protein
VVVEIEWSALDDDKELRKFMLKVSSPVDFDIDNGSLAA